MSTTFSNALSGLSANAAAIDTVSGNLANLNTFGYKTNQVSFQDLVAQSLGSGANAAKVGGSTVAQSTRTFTQGSIQSTGQPFDAAVQGNGFFVLRAPSGQQVFSRAGNFKVDATGHLLTAGGDAVQGWNAVNGTLSTNGGIGDLVIPIAGLRQPTATANFTVTANINAGAKVNDTFTSPIPVVDSQGTSHTLTITYTKSAANGWDYDISVPSAELTAGGGGATTSLATGTLTFDGQGHLLTPDLAAGPVPITITGLADGASDMTVNWNLYDALGVPTLTQYSQASANVASTQDGAASGQLTNMSIGAGGQILAHYSNGDSLAVGQIALGSILNPESMQDLGDNRFGATSATSLAAIGMPGTGSRGDITGGALEASTVDIAKEFTNLLTFERGYQANSKVITTEDDIMQETVGLKR